MSSSGAIWSSRRRRAFPSIGSEAAAMTDQGLEFLRQYEGPADQPKYARLSGALLAAIEAGYWAPGEKLPTESRLVAATPFSLGTVQRAMRSLVESGVVVRRQGAGSYVAAVAGRMDDPWHLRFLGDDGVSFLPVYPKVVFRDRLSGSGPWCDYLGIDPSDEVVRVDRRIEVAGEFNVFSRFYVEAERYGGLLYRPLDELDGANFKQILRTEFGLSITEIAQDVAIAAFDEEVRAALDVAASTDGLLLQVVARAGPGRPIYYQELFVPPTDRRLHIAELREGLAV